MASRRPSDGRRDSRPSRRKASADALASAEPPSSSFDHPKLEWRRLFAELLGTFLLVLVGAGAAVVLDVDHHSAERLAAVVAPGLMVMAIILSMGAVSGAHLNPVVTLAFALRNDFPWRRVPGYVIAQLSGASLASLSVWALYGSARLAGATTPGSGVGSGAAFLTEVLLTFGLVSTILGTASAAQNVGPLSAIGVGGYVVLAGLWASPISGASMNPARSFGPDLVRVHFGQYWIYVLGPLVGSFLAVGVAYILRGRGEDAASSRAAQGKLPDVRKRVR